MLTRMTKPQLRTLADVREHGQGVTITEAIAYPTLFYVHAIIGNRLNRFLMIGHPDDPTSVIEERVLA